MELLERIEKLKKSEKEILSDIYWIIFYIAMALVVLFISLIGVGVNNPMARILISIIVILIYPFALIYLIGLAVAFGTVRAKRVLLKTEIGVKEEEKQERDGI